jgi:putative transposase
MKLKSDYPIKMLCDLLALPRSSWYYRPVERDERELQRAVEQVVGHFPTFGHGLDVELTLQALHRALARWRPEIHHSDQGLQYAATDYVAALKRHKVEISMAAVGHAEENGYAERVIRTIKKEVALNEYSDLASAKLHIGRFIDDVYCTKRIHSSLGYLTPAEFATQWSKRSL